MPSFTDSSSATFADPATPDRTSRPASSRNSSRVTHRAPRVTSRKRCACIVLAAIVLLFSACTREEAPTAPGGVEIPGATFELPKRWQVQAPASTMRVAQAQVPGDGGAAEMAVFHFGSGQGGSVEANLQRWVGLVEPDAGAQPQRDGFQTNGCTVTWVDVSGTLKPGQMGMGPPAAQPDSRLLGAVVEGPNGPWFFRLSGPRATVTAARDEFLQMLRTVKPKTEG